jgi:hypothetical protein
LYDVHSTTTVGRVDIDEEYLDDRSSTWRGRCGSP